MIWSVGEVRSRLGEQAQKYRLRMPQMQTLPSQERFIARLASLEESRGFVWKGGSLVLRLYQHLEKPRFTVDIDLLANGIDIDQSEVVFRKAMIVDLEDGFRFLDIKHTDMVRKTPYGGHRFEVHWTMFNSEQSESLKIDVCAGDDVDATATSSDDLFVLPEGENISMKVYPAEFIFAEKLETANRFFTGNTRLKDFIDLWNLIRHPMDTDKLTDAIHRCFNRRGREVRMERLEQIFTNTEYATLMEAARSRRYNDLDLSTVKVMFGDILAFVSQLKLEDRNRNRCFV